MDVCKNCCHWDQHWSKAIRQTLKQVRSIMVATEESYWEDFDKDMGQVEEQHEKPWFLEAMVRYLTRAHPRPEEEEQHTQAEEICHHELLKCLDVLEPMVRHWQLRDHIRASLQDHQAHPQAGLLYLWYDFEEKTPMEGKFPPQKKGQSSQFPPQT